MVKVKVTTLKDKQETGSVTGSQCGRWSMGASDSFLDRRLGAPRPGTAGKGHQGRGHLVAMVTEVNPWEEMTLDLS